MIVWIAHAKVGHRQDLFLKPAATLRAFLCAAAGDWPARGSQLGESYDTISSFAPEDDGSRAGWNFHWPVTQRVLVALVIGQGGQ
jgi:hypothetical protein